MIDEIEILEQADRYLANHMSNVEKEAFEALMNEMPRVRHLVEMSVLANEVVVVHEAQKLKKRMQRDLANQNSSSIYLKVLLLAAGAIALGYFINERDTRPVMMENITVPLKQNSIKAQASEGVEKKPSGEIGMPISNHGESVQISNEKIDSNIQIQKTDPTRYGVLSNEGEGNGEFEKVNKDPEIKVVAEGDKYKKIKDCSGLHYEVEFTTSASCKDRATGSIFISPKVKNCKGGFCEIWVEDLPMSNRVENLNAGTYTIWIKDQNGCIVENTQKAIVQSRNCQKILSEVFNPEYDKVWKVPYHLDKEAVSLTIKGKNGLVYYSAHKPNLPDEWNGVGNEGRNVDPGLYFITIEYSDGIQDIGTLTVSQ